MPDHQASAPAPASDGVLRRRLLGAGVAGLAASLLPRLTGRASAGTDEPAATTTAPPRRPTDGDVELLAFAQTVELAAVALYDAALGVVDGPERAVFATVRESHQAYAQSIGAALGRPAPGVALASVVDELRPAFSSGSATDIASAAYDLEATALATHTELVGLLQGTEGAALAASILIVEARHCSVMAAIAGQDLDAQLLSDADALQPTEG